MAKVKAHDVSKIGMLSVLVLMLGLGVVTLNMNKVQQIGSNAAGEEAKITGVVYWQKGREWRDDYMSLGANPFVWVVPERTGKVSEPVVANEPLGYGGFSMAGLEMGMNYKVIACMKNPDGSDYWVDTKTRVPGGTTKLELKLRSGEVCPVPMPR